MPGVDILNFDTRYVFEALKRQAIVAMVFTHGHDDHIAAPVHHALIA